MLVSKTVALRVAAVVLMGALAVMGVARAQQRAAPVAPEDFAITKGMYGDWKLRCENRPGAQSTQCAISQNVVDEASPDIKLSMIVFRTADGKNTLMRVVAPLGILLPRGLGLKIDDADFGRVGFVRCLPSGCVSEVALKDNLLENLRTGKVASFLVFKAQEQGVGIPITLEGFAEAYDNLPTVVP